MDWEKINNYVQGKQHLKNKCFDVLKCVDDIAGLNSITATTPYLSLLNRLRNFEKSRLDEEMYEKKRLFRLRLMRGTLFIVTRNFLPIAYSATIDRTQKRLAGFRKYYRISEKEFKKLKYGIINVLENGEKTAREIKKELGTTINISRILRLLMEDVPLLRAKPLGTWKGEQYRYSLLPENIRLRMNKEKAAILLVEKFLQSFGPATLRDLAWWSGFGKKESKKILENIKSIDIGEGLLLLEKEGDDFENFKADDEYILLLSGFDQYVITFKYSVCPRLAPLNLLKSIYNEYGEFYDPIIKNGRIVGRWWFKNMKIGYLLYDKVKDMKLLKQKVEEMEEFLRE